MEHLRDYMVILGRDGDPSCFGGTPSVFYHKNFIKKEVIKTPFQMIYAVFTASSAKTDRAKISATSIVPIS